MILYKLENIVNVVIGIKNINYKYFIILFFINRELNILY